MNLYRYKSRRNQQDWSWITAWNMETAAASIHTCYGHYPECLEFWSGDLLTDELDEEPEK